MTERHGTRTRLEAVVLVAARTDARGARVRFGGPASELGWSTAHAARRAREAGIGGRRGRNA